MFVEYLIKIMEGKLINKDGKWIVEACIGEILINNTPKRDYWELELHPDDVKQINEDAQTFDNIEARIAAHSNVTFRVVNEYSKEQDKFVNYAYLTPCK